jgi:hypothetical protein
VSYHLKKWGGLTLNHKQILTRYYEGHTGYKLLGALQGTWVIESRYLILNYNPTDAPLRLIKIKNGVARLTLRLPVDGISDGISDERFL